jgi:hypothetical protein
MFADCKKCKYYLEHPTNFDDLAKCKKFEYIIKHNNKIYYEYAEACRKNNKKCGLEAKEFISILKK